MTKGKKILTVVVCAAVAVGGGTGGTLLYRAKQTQAHKVSVTSVYTLMDYYWGDEISMDGTVVSGDVQSITLSSDQLVDKVLVQEGDTVTVGTPLLEYDTTAVALEAAQKKTALAVAEDNVRQAKKELERIKALKSSEEAPASSYEYYEDYGEDAYDWYGDEDSEEDAELTPQNTVAVISSLTQSAAGTGTQEDPFQFACTGDTVVQQTVLEQIHSAGSYAAFVVYDTTGANLYAWLVSGSTLPDTVTDWMLGEQITVTDDGGVQVRGTGHWYGTIQVGGTYTYDPAAIAAQTETALEETEVETETDTETTHTESALVATAMIQPTASLTLLTASTSDSEDYVYTKAQLKQKQAEQEIAIQSAEIAQKQAQLEYDSAAEKEENNQELAKINGVVTKLAASVEELEQDEAFLVVQGSGGVQVEGSVSEMNLDKLTVGALIQVSSWDTGETVTAEVTEIDTTPTSYSTDDYGENPNSSTYPFRAEITESVSFSVGSYVSLSFSDDSASDHFYLPLSYVCQEDGVYYVMKESEDHKLVKQVVQTGKIIYGGYSIEIISGLDESDAICFPYGKYVTEGATVETDDSAEEG